MDGSVASAFRVQIIKISFLFNFFSDASTNIIKCLNLYLGALSIKLHIIWLTAEASWHLPTGCTTSAFIYKFGGISNRGVFGNTMVGLTV